MFKKKKVLAATQGGGYQQRVVADGASHYWPLDELVGSTAVDVIGGLNGTIAGGVTLNQVPAINSGKSMLFNGTTGKITMGSLNFPVNVSIEAWMRTTASTVQQPALSNFVSTGNGLYIGTFNGLPFLFSTVGGTSLGTIADGNWHHVVFLLQGFTNIIYVDGVNVTGLQNQGHDGIPTNPFSIATSVLSDFWNGSLDEIAIYPLILTPTQIATHYSFKSTAPVLTYKQQVIADGASAYWPMDNVGPPITDLAGTRNASVSGSPTFGVPGPRAATAMTFSRTASAIPPSAVPVGLSFTLEAWIRRTAVFTRAFIMARNITSQNDWYLAFNTTGSDRIQFAYRDASTTNTFFFPITFPLNTWTYVVLVVTGTVLQLYVNGLPVGASQPMVTLGGAGSGAFQLASNIGSASEAWGGQLADLAIYPLVLSADKILAHSTAL